jgi:hypothetical protein
MAGPNAGGRAASHAKSRADLEAFMRANSGRPLAAEAAMEIARITSLQAQAAFSQARTLDTVDGKRAALIEARQRFEEAGRQLDAAAEQIRDQLQAAQTATSDKDSLYLALLQANLDRGVNFLRQAQTYSEQDDDSKRLDLLKKATEMLNRLAGLRENTKSRLCWQALAWAGYCQLERDDPKEAQKTFGDVITASGEPAEDAKRLARYFRLLSYALDPQVKGPAVQIQQAGEEWLRLYSDYVETSEGRAVRFEVARACLAQADGLVNGQRSSPTARDLYERALRLFQDLEQTENEFAPIARARKLQIILAMSPERANGDISQLKSFEECYLRAQLEVAKLNDGSEQTQGTGNHADGKQHMKNIVVLLSRGLELADKSASQTDLNDARFMLAYTCLATGDFHRAAAVGEELARAQPQFTRAPMAGAYALRAYAAIAADSAPSSAQSADVATLRRQMRTLAEFIERTWPGDGAADIARHTMGLAAIADKNYAEAVETLDRVSPTYSDRVQSLYQLAAAALQADKEGIPAPVGRPSFQERALAALAGIPEPSTRAPPSIVRTYFAAKLMLADIYYRAKQYKKLATLAQALTQNLDNVDEKLKGELQIKVHIFQLYAVLGGAETAYAAGRYAEACELLEPLVSQMHAPAKREEWALIKEKDQRLVRALMGLALSANVQDSRPNRGKEILANLQQHFPENSFEVLLQLGKELNAQIQTLRQQGEPAKEQLESTQRHFAAFVELVEKQQTDNPRPEIMLFLAGSYSSLDNHKKAAELASLIREPASMAGQTMPDPKALSIYHVARLLYVRELRLAKEFKSAAKAITEVQATAWGQNSLEVRKERVLLLEDQESLSGKNGAITAWNNLMQQLRPRLGDNKIKEQYFDCYYHMTWCIYQNALKATDPKKKAKDIRLAANFIVKLEGQPDASGPVKQQFADLLAREPSLKEQYDELKKEK